MSDSLGALAALVERRSGIAVGPGRLPALRAAIDRVCPGAAPDEVSALTADPRYGVATLDRLIDEITINETFFMRHRAELDAIPWAGLLDNARRRGHSQVRVWSAACATGEEAYSLLILALEALRSDAAPVSVLATDISATCLALAGEARYGARSLRHVAADLRHRYFEPAGESACAIRSDLRKHVRLAQHNLVRDPMPPAGETPFDVILCRNVLIYFDTETAAKTVARLRTALSPNGLIVLGASDRLMLRRSELVERAKPAVQRRRTPRSVAALKPRSAETRPAAAEQALSGSAEPAPLALALADADAGRLDGALGAIEPILAADPLNTVALCIQGLVLHAQGDPAAALVSLRRAVYLDPAFVRAAFELGRVHDGLGDSAAARRAYRQALEGLEGDSPGDPILGHPDDGVADACRVRLARSAQAVGR
jgi:chemotaxis methyl-accepting protein methylase